MLPVKKEFRKFSRKSFKDFVLGCDIGGTNTNIGVFGIKRKPKLLFSFHFKSQQLKRLHEAVNYTLNYVKNQYKINITKACFGVAGVISPDKNNAMITKLKWHIINKELFKKTRLRKILLINDFQAIGYAINIIGKKDIVVIKKCPNIEKAPIIVIGAGTGLGKTTLIYNDQNKFYMPLASEAGHSDFAVQNKDEFELVDFIKRSENIKNVSYDSILSGKGLERIYLFLTKSKKFTKFTKEINKSNNKPELISKYRKTDKTCKETFEIFKKIYVKFARNFALDALPLGGIYIAGGIAPKNKDIFDKNFIKIFEQHEIHHYVLQKIPIYLIMNYDAGMLGAGFAAAKFL